jgi:acyl transferase domain-containing protein/SAM-dependent methyltransferase
MEARLEMAVRARTEPIAVIGIGCRFPGGVTSPETFWCLLRDGVDAITEVPPYRWELATAPDQGSAPSDNSPARWGGFLDGTDQFDADFFGVSPREAQSMDPQQRMVLEVAWEALEDAGQIRDRLAGSSTGVFLGIYNSDYSWLQLRHPNDFDAYSGTGTAHCMTANRLSYFLDLRGPSLVVDTTCSSSLVAVHLACQSLRTGECRLAVAGGVNLIFSPLSSLRVARMLPLAVDGRCKAFDARADGIVRGEGCGIVLLKRLSEALADGDPVWAVIRGSAVNQDGRSNGLTAPNGLSQRAVILQALKKAGIAPDQISYVEAHGTGTPLGDPIEVEALRAALTSGRSRGSPCALGSVKTNLGHLEAAAGIAGLIKVVLALHYEAIPPHLHLESLNPMLASDLALFEVPTSLRPWPSGATRRFAGVSSFSLGGTNAHVILEEAPRPEPTPVADEKKLSGRVYLLPLSARNPEALRCLARSYRDFLTGTTASLHDIAYTAGVRRTHHEHRLALVGRFPGETANQLDNFLRAESPPGLSYGRIQGRRQGLVFVFCGQGAQWPGMGQELLHQEPVFYQEVERCDALFRRHAGWSLREALAAHPARLEQTEVAQPVLFALQVGLTALWRSWGVVPDAIVGHSAGEVAAAHVAGALSLEDAVRLVFHRSRLLQRINDSGKMLAVDLPVAEAERVVRPYEGRLVVAAVNSPTSTVLSGDTTALQGVVEVLQQRHIACQWLRVSSPFHTPQLNPIREELLDALQGLEPHPPALPIVPTVPGRPEDGRLFGPPYWWRNVREPVQFMAAVDRLAADHSLFLEVGPHPILSRDILHCLESRGREGTVLPSFHREREERATLLESLGKLFALGHPIDWTGIFPSGGRYVRLPSYPWQRHRHWIEPGGSTATGQEPIPWCYQVCWRPLEKCAPLDGEPAAAALTGPFQIVKQLQTRESMAATARGLKVYERIRPRLDRLCAAYAFAGLLQLGWDPQTHANLPEAALARQLRTAPRHERLCGRLVEIAYRTWQLAPQDPTWQDLHTQEQRLQDEFPECEAELTLLRLCGSRLAEILRGQRDPLELLFGEGASTVERLYRDSPLARTLNALVRHVICTGLGQLPSGTRVRILEVGAGTGGLTSFLLPALPAGQVQYVFTDISQLFLLKAAHQFRDFSFMHYRLLDIERDPALQGFSAPEFDLILAGNVLHATADLRQVLSHVRQLLSPEGLLVLLEITQAQPWMNLTFGLTEGWWKFTDSHIRPRHPLLSSDQWVRLLGTVGFTEAVAVPAAGDSETAGGPGVVLLARRPPAITDSRPRALSPPPSPDRGSWILLADRGGVASRLEEFLEAHGERCVHLKSGKTYVQVGERHVEVNPACPDDFHRLVRELRERAQLPCRGVVHLWSLDGPGPDETTPATLAEASLCGCGSVLHLLQSLVPATPNLPCRFWLVTRRAQPVGNPVGPLAVAQAPLWGLGRVLASEHPELWGGLMDLDSPADPVVEATTLGKEILAPTGEDWVGWRRGQRYVARLARLHGLEMLAAHVRLCPEATYLITGGLGGMGLHVARWMVERGAQNLVLVGRRGAERSGAREAVQVLERGGARVQVAKADVARPEAVARLLDDVKRSLPPLRGLVHAAGVFDDRLLLGQDWERFIRVLQPKMFGAWNLHTQTLGLALDFFVLFSSATILLGLTGLSNYTAANMFLDALACHRRHLGLPALSIAWSGWANVGMAGTVGRRREQQWLARGMWPLAPDQGLQVFEQLLQQPAAQVGVLPIDWERYLERFPFSSAPPFFSEVANGLRCRDDGRRDRVATLSLLQCLRQSTPAEQEGLLLEHLSSQVAKLLRLNPGRALDAEQPLRDLGLDSLMAIELRNVLSLSLGRPLPATLLFDHPTLSGLARYLAKEILGSEGPTTPRLLSRTATDRASVLAEIEQLTEEQVDAILGELTGKLLEEERP